MNLSEANYSLYKGFLKKYRPHHCVFYLADLIHLMRDDQEFLNGEQIREKWQERIRLIKNGAEREVLNFYIHVPFCRAKCTYCKYYSNLFTNKKLSSYLNRITKQIDFFKETFSGSEFSSFYIGGGTPSVLNKKQMEGLLSDLFASFKFKDNGERTFESNPESTSLDKLRVLKRFGFNRVSFGVQSLDKRVLSYANRDYQDYKLIKTAVENAKSLGFEVNTDIMIGLRGESNQSIVSSFIELTRIRPDSITLYLFKPSEEYLGKYFENDYRAFNSLLFKKARIVLRTLKSKEKTLNYIKDHRSYEICTVSDPTFRHKDFKSPYKFPYGYTSPFTYPKPCSLLALGTRASSYISNSLQYHDAGTGQEAAEFEPGQRNYWSLKFDLKDEMRYFILQQLSSRLCLSQNEFKNYFNSGFTENFKSAIGHLQRLGKIKFKKDLVFLPSEPLERYACAMFFLDEGKTIKKIKSFLLERI